MARTKSEPEAISSHNGSQARRFHSSDHSHRSLSPIPGSQQSALVSAAIGALAVTAVDKYLIEDTSKNDRSSLNDDQLFRRFANIAIGGYARLKAYRHFRNSPREQIHQTSKYPLRCCQQCQCASLAPTLKRPNCESQVEKCQYIIDDRLEL